MKVIDFNQAGRQDERDDRRANFFEAVEAFRSAMEKEGLGRPEVKSFDGKLLRFDLPGEKRGKESGWYVYYSDNIPAGAFGSWKHDLTIYWCSRQNYEMSQAEIDAVRERQRQAREARDVERKNLAVECAKIAASKWENAEPETGSHPYLARKQVGAFGVKSARGELLVPMWTVSGEIASLQRIYPDGGRRYLRGTIKDGLFGWIEGDQSTIYLAEGYATAASIHMATGHAVAIAFDAGNLESAAQSVRRVFPQTQIVVAADNDRWSTKADGTPWNVGVEKAQAAAHAIGSKCIIPDFKDLSSRPTDFNDLHVLEGLEVVRSSLVSKEDGPVILDWDSCRMFSGEPPEREWLVHGVFPRGQVSLVAAAGGVGKSFMLLGLARGTVDNDAIRPSHFGGPILASGKAVYVAAEDDQIEIHSRLHTLGGPIQGLYAIPLPSAGGTKHYFHLGQDKSPATTPAWNAFVRQARRIDGLLLLILDPLQPLCALDLNLPENAQFVCSELAKLAAELNIAIILSHHFRKAEVDSPEEARQAIRGTAGIVDGVRSVYALWQAPQSDAKDIMKRLDKPYAPDSVVYGCVVKSNGVKSAGVRTFIREQTGVLVDYTSERKAESRDGALDMLRDAIAAAAGAGMPYTISRENGIWERRHELPKRLQDAISKRSLPGLIDELLSTKRVVKTMAKGGKTVKWLDIPEGNFAMGCGDFALGFNQGIDNA